MLERFMKKIHRKSGKKSKGFTLIELMIVVAIIGILAAIAIPNFLRFQAKSKQSEAKTNLGAIGTTAEAYRAEYDTYAATSNQLGWAPQGTTRYEYWYTANDPAGVQSSWAASLGTCSGCTSCGTSNTGGLAAGTNTFLAGAVGQIDADPTCDEWGYNQNRSFATTTGANAVPPGPQVDDVSQ